MGELPERTLEEIEGVLQRFPRIRWVKLYGSRALGTQRPGSDIDLAFSCPEDDCSAALAGLNLRASRRIARASSSERWRRHSALGPGRRLSRLRAAAPGSTSTTIPQEQSWLLSPWGQPGSAECAAASGG